MRVVIDASVGLKWLCPDAPGEQDVAKALAILGMIETGRASAFEPVHWIAEIMAVIARQDTDEIRPARLFFEVFPFTCVGTLDTIEHAARLASKLNHHLFDTLYHAVALEHDAMLVTADERYFARAKEQGGITLLQDFDVPA